MTRKAVTKAQLQDLLFEAVAILYSIDEEEVYDDMLLFRIKDFLERAGQVGYV